MIPYPFNVGDERFLQWFVSDKCIIKILVSN